MDIRTPELHGQPIDLLGKHHLAIYKADHLYIAGPNINTNHSSSIVPDPLGYGLYSFRDDLRLRLIWGICHHKLRLIDRTEIAGNTAVFTSKQSLNFFVQRHRRSMDNHTLSTNPR